MERICELPLFGVFVSLTAFVFATLLYERFRKVILNPVLISVILIISFLKVFNVEYAQYNIGGQYLTFFLGPSVVALGVLFYEKYVVIKRNLMPFFLSVLAGSLMSLVSVILICLMLSAPDLITRSLVLKSITTPIAVEVSPIIGGLPYLTVGVVILVGILGNAFGEEVLRFLKIKSPSAIGTALGTASHGIGTARALEVSDLAGAYSGLAMCLNGILTSFLAPVVVEGMLKILYSH